MSQFDNGNHSSDSKENYSLNFSISHKDPNSNYFAHNSMSSNVISETALMDDYILLKKKSLLKRKFLSSEKIYYREIVDLDLIKSSSSSLFASIKIIYSKNGYSKRALTLSSSDAFAVRWFYDALVVRYSYFKSDLNKKYDFGSSENKWIEENKSVQSDLSEEYEGSDLSEHLAKSAPSKQSEQSKLSKQSTLSDFFSQMNRELSDDEKHKLKKKMQFERCSNGEY